MGQGEKIRERALKAKRLRQAVLLVLGLLGLAGDGDAQEMNAPGGRDGSGQRLPVLLVPGWFEESGDLAALEERLHRDGWGEGEVLALDFADPVGSNLAHAGEVKEAMEVLRARTGSPKVDIVAHSMGGLAVWVLLQREGRGVPVRRVVFLASPLQGTLTAYLAWGEGGREMRPGSPFLQALEAGGEPQRWVQALTIRTPLDLNVLPGDAATLPGIRDRMVCCPTHQGLLDHEETFEITRDFLLCGLAGSWVGPVR